MTASSSGAMLFARLQLMAPDARRVLVATPRSIISTAALAEELATAARDSGVEAVIIDSSAASKADGNSAWGGSAASSAAGSAEPVLLRNSGSIAAGYAVVQGEGILDNAATLLAVREVDAVVVLVQQGKTTRAELEDVRREIEQAGGRLLGAIIQR